jgi:predicted RNase H-like HicB family nuclease
MAKGKEYQITLRWSEEEHAYIAQADDLPGVTGKGDTKEHALAAVQDAIRWWLDAPTEGTRSSGQQTGGEPQQP